MKLLTIVGARPQFIKTAIVSRAIQKISEKAQANILQVVVHTGQHYDKNMSDIFFSEMQIPKPDYSLAVGSASHAVQTAKMMLLLEETMLKEKPDLVLVFGDTNSTLAGAITAAKLQIPIAHVEAGLRSFNRAMPEEINRILTDQLAELLFCPTEEALKNLKDEGIPSKKLNSKVFFSGDVMFDAAIHYSKIAGSSWLNRNSLQSKNYILATVHRAENTDNKVKLKGIITALDQISRDFMPLIWPIHPRTMNLIQNDSDLKKMANQSNFITTNPIGYIDMVCAEKNARLILTDSGGIQKEAFFHKVPCITLRNETEWVELVNSGWNVLAGTEPDFISNCTKNVLAKNFATVKRPNFYGSGNAGDFIVRELLNWRKKNG